MFLHQALQNCDLPAGASHAGQLEFQGKEPLSKHGLLPIGGPGLCDKVVGCETL